MKLMLYEEWTKSVHQEDGLTIEKEKAIRNDVTAFIFFYGKLAELSSNTAARAIVFFHKYSKVNSFKKFDYMLFAAACIFLSTKLDERPTKLDSITRLYFSMYLLYRKFRESSPLGSSELRPEDFTKKVVCEVKLDERTLKTVKERIIQAEKEVLNMLGYDLDFELPYMYLEYMRMNKIIQNERVFELAKNIISTSFKTLLCLYYDPRLIAVGAVNVAQRQCSHEVMEVEVQENWYKCLGDDLNKEEVDFVTNFLKEN